MVRPTHQLRDEEYVQAAVGKAEVMLGAARSFLFETVGEVYGALSAKRPIQPRVGAQFTAVHTYIHEVCADVVQLMYKVRGGSAVYTSGCLTDAFVTRWR